MSGFSYLNIMGESQTPRMSDKFLNKLLLSDCRMYYPTRKYNDRLFLHYKGFRRIENLGEFCGLKALYLEGNALVDIEGLESLGILRSLYLQENCIKQI